MTNRTQWTESFYLVERCNEHAHTCSWLRDREWEQPTLCVCVYVLVCVCMCTTGILGSDEGSLSRPSHRGARGEEPIASWKSQSRAAREAFGTHERKMQSCVDVLPPHTRHDR